ncbi:MAG: hypothetical protein EZS28_051837 [Streblomastix strix]|uniref:Uncharacterized protein n=1 Tax=Streblomastix strix TaxID=222440 RepID=A0A5J4T006_9EUKA|nr:MAG: hypothetical protein EZS28_051837 [Streblomastix strix]
MLPRPAMVYKFNESVKKVLYPLTAKPILNQEIWYGKPQKFFSTWKDGSNPHGPEVEMGRIFLTQIFDGIELFRGVCNHSSMDLDSRLRNAAFMQREHLQNSLTDIISKMESKYVFSKYAPILSKHNAISHF